MSAEMIPLDFYLSSKMRKKFDDQEKFNGNVSAQIKFMATDIETLYDNYLFLQQKIDRLCKT